MPDEVKDDFIVTAEEGSLRQTGAAKNVNHRLWTQPNSTTRGPKGSFVVALVDSWLVESLLASSWLVNDWLVDDWLLHAWLGGLFTAIIPELSLSSSDSTKAVV
ncbi:hypothetical protein MTO96_045079 [Rhipicephalus appendiculatus]